MTETETLEQPAGGALEEALKEALDILDSPAIEDEEQLAARLDAIQEACSGMVRLVERGSPLPTGLLERALGAVSHGLGVARQHLERAQGQLRAVQRSAWTQALLAAADMCLHSERWHAAWHAEAGGGGKAAYLRTAGLARDALKEGLLPLLVGAAEQQSAASGFCLAAEYEALLEMGRTAGEIVGMRDGRHRRPGLRNFSVLNVLWNGIQRLWVAAPSEVQADMERRGLGGGRVLGVVLALMGQDVRACHRLLDPGMGKLLLYWAQKAGHVLAAYPAAGPACWGPLLEVPLCAQRELALLAAAGGDSAAALGEALRGKVAPAALRLLAAALNAAAAAAAEDQLRVMLDGLRMRLSGGDQALPALHTTLHLLHAAPSLQPLARHHCVALLGAVLEAMPGQALAAAVRSGELRGQVADAALLFLAACCHAAAAAAGSEDVGAWERQLVGQTWERCQQQLFLHALQPHPLTAAVLGRVWGDLGAAASDPLLKGHITVLRDMLRCTAAAAGGARHAPPSPLCAQLAGLLAALLAAAPPATRAAYFANFLQLPSPCQDACQLACLAAELRVAALVDGGGGGGAGPTGAAAPQAAAVLQGLWDLLNQAGPLVLARQAAGGGGGDDGGGAGAAGGGAALQAEADLLAWVLEALRCAVAYAAATHLHQECRPLLAAVCRRVAALLGKTVPKGQLAFAAPSLALLAEVLPLEVAPPGGQQEAAEPLLPAQVRQALVPVLAACQQRPELAAAAAALLPAVARCAAPHAHLAQAVLSQRSQVAQHVGLEAFRLYLKACPMDADMAAVLAASLPPSLRKPETGRASDGFSALMRRYSQRCPAGGARVGEREAAAWAAALREEALGSVLALRRELEAQRAQQATGAGGQGGRLSGAGGQAPAVAALQQQDGGGGGGGGSVAAAAQEVLRCIAQLGSMLPSGGGGLDAGAAATLRQCSEQLAQLLACSSV